MINGLNIFTLIIAIGICVPIVVIFIESVAALLPVRVKKAADDIDVSFAILIPAHNEAAVIANTLRLLTAQISDPKSAVVIADNCTDNTAAIARELGVTVIERFDTEKKGKGYALDYGLQYLDANRPDIVAMLDADCTIEDGGIQKIVHASFDSGRPVQAVYLQRPPSTPSTNDLVSSFAFLVKNLVRPQGLYNLGQPCLLTGSGMAFPWDIIRHAPLASGNIVEDMQLGLDLALAGHAPLLVPNTIVWGELPEQTAAATTQRTRWEHGHLQTLLTQVPRLLKGAVKQLNFGLLALALDLSVPPLALLVILWSLVTVITLIAGIIGASWNAAIVVGIAGIVLLLSIGGAWLKFGRNTLPFTTLLAIPFYIAWKIPLYIGFVFKRQTAWIRTERE